MAASTYQRVLVPLDGSLEAETVIPFVERVAGPVDAELVLLRVVPPLSAGEAAAAAGVADPDVLVARELDARGYLEELAGRLAGKGLRVRSVVRVGPPASEIVAVSADIDADLVAMSTRARTGLGRLLLGSVADEVLRAAPGPVLLVRRKAGTA